MDIHIVGAGPKTNTISTLSDDNKNCMLIGVDNGAYYLIEEELIPEAIFGDFDSLSNENLAKIKALVPHVFIYPPEKDETDLELALQWAISQKPKNIFIHCVTGRRLDHEFGSIALLIKFKDSGIPIKIVDEFNEMYVMNSGTHLISKVAHFKYISFFSLGNLIENLTLIGFKYPLTNHLLEIGSSLCVSNELAQDEGSISFSSGIALVVRSKD
ncbi:thiamine diphosphokinase [Gottfriedia luciferensis]|uniref:thiamine diphosphokinase n=1 Tax=Gottfriedia luciferensis TaxID=178774 RepID=UPI000B43FF4A|nr:thiamine diphosphokinase [Gottfriedia luciferensis]